MRTTLSNTTVKFNAKQNTFSVYKGKGTGSQIAMFNTMDEAVKFNNEFSNLEYKSIIQISTGKKGCAYFYRDTNNMLDVNHPYFNDFKIN